jgi:hypothetical protein
VQKLPQCLLVNGSSPPDHIRNKRPPPREVICLVLDELETVRAAVTRGLAFVSGANAAAPKRSDTNRESYTLEACCARVATAVQPAVAGQAVLGAWPDVVAGPSALVTGCSTTTSSGSVMRWQRARRWPSRLPTALAYPGWHAGAHPHRHDSWDPTYLPCLLTIPCAPHVAGASQSHMRPHPAW